MINLNRKRILDFLQWNDKNGHYTDEICNLENIPYLTIEDNIFELSFDKIIEYAKTNGFYKETCNKLNQLLNNESANYNLLYKNLLK